ncbi:hypothetical protein RhiJN_18645 [Ceratobasidium sp. AG-Ba]|nr:hypothetical protein RhiJN_18645 [Ceratobasidium sp. AG-Ba]
MSQRFQMFLDNSHGVAIHLHILIKLNFHGAAKEITSILKPYIRSLRSLDVYDPGSSYWINDLVQLCIESGTSSSLKTYKLQSYAQPVVVPGSLFSGLVNLSLSSITGTGDVSQTELAETLSGAPNLRMLQLSKIYLYSPEGNGPVKAIHLPCLRILQLYDIHGPAKDFVPSLHPGGLELDVRLGFLATHVTHRWSSASLLARSNVISLTFHVNPCARDFGLEEVISCTPRLRSLILVAQGGVKYRVSRIGQLGMFLRAEGSNTSRLPHLLSLCFIGHPVYSDDIDWLKYIVNVTKVRLIGFLSCKFAEVRQVAELCTTMPMSFEEWLEAHVDRVVIDEVPMYQVTDGTAAVVEQFRRV